MKPYLFPNALITADDWGMSPGINDGILELAERGLVRRVSCMARAQYLEHGLEQLKAIPGLELGLHFDLTFGKTHFEKYTIVFKSVFSAATLSPIVKTAFRDQWTRLKAVGITPSYLDGHHHIHLLPGVFSPLLEEAKYAGVKMIRTVSDPVLFFSGKFPVVVFSYALRPKLLRHGVSTLPSWYPNLERIGVTRLRLGLRALKIPTEVIVHPASRNDLSELHVPDSYTDERIAEYNILRDVTVPG